MKSRSRSNNFIALLIALILIATGFALAFIHRQSESDKKTIKTPVSVITQGVSEKSTVSV
jgi:hypothetical protein